jgi:hypothetical protein
MAQAAWLRQQPDQQDHHLPWPDQRDQLWPAHRPLPQWRAPSRRRSVRLPHLSVRPWPRARRRVSPHRRDRRHRGL